MMALSLPPLSITFKSIEQILGNLTGAGEHERQRWGLPKVHLVHFQLQAEVSRRCAEKHMMQFPGTFPSFIDLCLGNFLVHVCFSSL